MDQGCQYIITRGVNKGKCCDKSIRFGGYCKKHLEYLQNINDIYVPEPEGGLLWSPVIINIPETLQ